MRHPAVSPATDTVGRPDVSGEPARDAPRLIRLQQLAGNRVVGRMLARSPVVAPPPPNKAADPAHAPPPKKAEAPAHPMAYELELAKGAKKSHALADREHYLQARLINSSETKRSELLAQLRAVEKVSLQTREPQSVVQTLDPEIERLIALRKEILRLIVWKGSANEGLDVAESRDRSTRSRVQSLLVRRDMETVKSEFDLRARSNVQAVLDASASRIAAMLGSYGLVVDVDHAEAMVHEVAAGREGSSDTAAKWLAEARSTRAAQYEGGAAKRSDLGKRIPRLKALQREYQRQQAAYFRDYGLQMPPRRTPAAVKGPMGETIKAALDKKRAAAAKLTAARIAMLVAFADAERVHPELAVYRRDFNVGELEGVGGASPAADKATRHLLSTAIDTLVNIQRAKWAIRQHKVSPLELGPIVAMTRAQMLIQPGSYWDAAVQDLLRGEDEGVQWAKTALKTAFAAVTLVGGGVFAILGMGLDLVSAGSELGQYMLDETLIGTDFDVAMAISDKTPSLFGFAMALLSAGVNVLAARSLLKRAEPVYEKALAGDPDAIEFLNKLGQEAAAIERVGSDLAAGAREARAAEPVPAPHAPEAPKLPTGEARPIEPKPAPHAPEAPKLPPGGGATPAPVPAPPAPLTPLQQLEKEISQLQWRRRGLVRTQEALQREQAAQEAALRTKAREVRRIEDAAARAHAEEQLARMRERLAAVEAKRATTRQLIEQVDLDIAKARYPLSREAEDLAVANHPAPARRPLVGRTIGKTPQQELQLQADVAEAGRRGARDIRINQQQVDAARLHQGTNRPDLQYTLNGRRVYIEYEQLGNPRGLDHAKRLIKNDPTAVVYVKRVPKTPNFTPGQGVIVDTYTLDDVAALGP
jgi:hypothetical protein